MMKDIRSYSEKLTPLTWNRNIFWKEKKITSRNEVITALNLLSYFEDE
ncbi:hypothetical protein [Chryseobacterium hispalense]